VSEGRPTAAYLSGSVFRGERPILLVLHNEDGDWQFLDGEHVDRDDGFAVHVSHVFAEHPELDLVADLPLGWAAERSSSDNEWERYPWPDETEE
jgi:hypothetical protein